jgi:hypothetical protein
MLRAVDLVAGEARFLSVPPVFLLLTSAVELLVKEGVEFGCFDILADQSVRNDLKKFSEWPTYPQLVHHFAHAPTRFTPAIPTNAMHLSFTQYTPKVHFCCSL